VKQHKCDQYISKRQRQHLRRNAAIAHDTLVSLSSELSKPITTDEPVVDALLDVLEEVVAALVAVTAVFLHRVEHQLELQQPDTTQDERTQTNQTR